MDSFKFIVSTPLSWPDPGIAIAASRWGATGLLNLENIDDSELARSAVAKLVKYGKGSFGIKVSTDSGDVAKQLLAELPEKLELVVLTGVDGDGISNLLELARSRSKEVLLETTRLEDAHQGLRMGVDGLIAKGNEAGGRVGEETALILLQRLVSEIRLPVWVHGGIGLHTVAACFVAGARGVVLDHQLALTSESLRRWPLKTPPPR